ncbi:hypothetical protein F4802DRAFT_110931 [Xylaria palmicola]|nr:hypothetical protein F4802DRAFT_110931 [Xylaria palmicola]
MTEIMLETPEYHGSLVAFEGPQEIISTQLRLLPNSPKILILPHFQYFLKDNDTSSPFDARLQILRTHEACDARAEMARNFLRESTPNNKRLVFMNGGTASAQMDCISSISKHETNGDVVKAETIFNELIQNGVSGLKSNAQQEKRTETFSKMDETADLNGQEYAILEDPISKAMRAAEALDLETAFLQESDEFGLPATTRPRSTSVPVLPVADDSQQSVAPFYVFGPTENTLGQGQLLYVEKWRAMTANEDQLPDPNIVPRSPSCYSDDQPTGFRPTSAVGPPRGTIESMPGSPALLGEALLIDVRSFTAPSHKRKSVDRLYATAIRNQDISLCNIPQSTFKRKESMWAQSNTQERESVPLEKPTLRSHFYRETPYPTFVRPNRAIVRKKLPSPLNLETMIPEKPESVDTDPVRYYTERRTLTEPILSMPATGTRESFELEADEPFQTVLPMTEDLVIYFKSQESNPRLEDMIRAFKHGRYPVSMPPLLLEPRGDTDRSGTPTTNGSTHKLVDEDTQDSPQDTRGSIPIYSPEEYDPYASHGNYLGHSPASYISKQTMGNPPQDAIIVSTLPSIAQTSPPETNAPPDKFFHEFDLKECKTAVCVQNSLRSILKVYFPSENIGYHQFNFPLLPELSSFWRPVFREIPSDDSKAARKIDLILAIGAQKGVDKSLLSAVSGSLEKLGRGPDGVSRSGRLDLRYLIANTMQAFTSQPLANQTQDNPFSNTVLLATLIIPHLETYIAAHSATRFLILEYPPEYLSTVLALQHLIGADLLKVAGIVDSEASDAKSSPSSRQQPSPSTTTSPSKATSAALFSPSRSKPKSETTDSTSTRLPQPSFSRANLILTSTATEFEIATFISTVWRILIEISPSYIPEKEPESDSMFDPYDHSLPQSSFVPSKEQYAPLLRAAMMLGFAPSQEDEIPHHNYHNSHHSHHHQRSRSRPQRWAPMNYVSSGTHADLPTPRRPATPARSTKGSIAGSSFCTSPPLGGYGGGRATMTPTTPRVAAATAAAVQSQRSKLRHLLGRDVAVFASGDAGLHYDVEDDDYDEDYGVEDRKYMSLWSQQQQRGGARKGGSHKALKWLGLSN